MTDLYNFLGYWRLSLPTLGHTSWDGGGDHVRHLGYQGHCLQVRLVSDWYGVAGVKTSGRTGRITLVLSGSTVLYCGAGLTVVTLGRVVWRTAGGGKGMTACSSGRKLLGLGIEILRYRY